MKQKILIGTNNPSKLTRMSACLDQQLYDCVSPAMLGLQVTIPENEATAEGNAREKALAFYQASKLPVLAADSGLVFLDLPRDHPDQPGVHVRRPAGHSVLTDDEDMIAYYTAVIRRHGGRLRAAWQDAWCFMINEETVLTFMDDDEILSRHAMLLVDFVSHSRHPGWPLDSLTYSEPLGKHWADLTHAEKAVAKEKDFIGFEDDQQRFRDWLALALSNLNQ